MVVDKVGDGYAEPIKVKIGPVDKSVITKAYMCIFVSFMVNAVHLEVVSELSTTAFIACPCRFTA